jgi:biotin synthase
VFYIQAETQTYPLIPVQEMMKTAQEAKAKGAERFCLVTSGMQLSEKDFTDIEITARHIVNELQIACDICVGFLSRQRIQRLKQAGVRRVNINLQSSEQFYPSIVTTHSWQDRLDNLKILKEEGMELCSGGIIGMGESHEDRLGLAFVLAELEAEVVPINILDARGGTKLEEQKKLSTFEILKSIAVFRFILPNSELKIAGGREVNLDFNNQVKALKCGGDGLITGGYLTTGGNSFEQDMKLIKEAGFQWGNHA